MTQQKLYTEEQVKLMLCKAKMFDGGVKEDFVYIFSESDILSAETPIEIPSDTEIENFAFESTALLSHISETEICRSLQVGAKWMREQIFKQTK
jgi:hypothetical protein